MIRCRQSCGLCGFMLRQVLQQELKALIYVLVLIKKNPCPNIKRYELVYLVSLRYSIQINTDFLIKSICVTSISLDETVDPRKTK